MNQLELIFKPIYIDTENVKIKPLMSVAWEKLALDLLYENSFHSVNWGIKSPADIKRMYDAYLFAYQNQKMNPIVFLNKQENTVLGITSLRNVEVANKILEIGGTWINKKYQQTYVNTETKLALLEYAFETLKLNRVEFHIDAENLVSQKAVQRLGFHYDGFLPQKKINGIGEVRDYVFYSVTRQNWPKVRSRIKYLIDKSKLPEFEDMQKAKKLLRENFINEAFLQIQNAIIKYPKSAHLHYLGACICDAHRTETEAVSFYLKALSLGIGGSDRRDALLGLASTYRTLGRYEESKKYFEIGIEEFPDYKPYYVFLALTQFNLQQSELSIKTLLELLIDSTSDQEIRSYQRALKFYSTRLSEVFK
jgi:RimJ/RimL family protein N-acetyltransferase